MSTQTFGDGFQVIEMNDAPRTGPGFGDRGTAPEFSGDWTGAQTRRIQKDKAERLSIRQRTADDILAGKDTELIEYGGQAWELPTQAVRIIRKGLDLERKVQR